MTHVGFLPPKLSSCHKELNNLCVHLLCGKSQRRAFTCIAIKAIPPRDGLSHDRSSSAEPVENKLDNRLPIMMDEYENNHSMPYVRATDKSKSNDYAIGNDDPKPDVSRDGYLAADINVMSDRYSGDKTKLAKDVRKSKSYSINNDPKMGYSRNEEFQGSESPYSRLKLGMNVLSFFHVSHKFSKARVDASNTDDFEGLMDMGTVLLKEGEQGLDGRLEVGIAARMLKEAAARFAAASAIHPSSLVAIDAWGTTLLVHGKLKLLLSEKLRDMLLDARVQSPRKDSNAQSRLATLEGLIPNVCEECEKLLVEAGRKFGKGVSMDKRDGHALYNWGLALFFRARLIAADGLEDVAKDADKIYLTAIDKFEATSKISKEYSGAAFLNWSLALRDRCWLRSMASKERIGFLEQAKWASEQALLAYPDSVEAKLAVLACIEDLKQLQSCNIAGQRPPEKGNSQRWSGWN
eukprot:c21907_g1_i1 orf=442-1833(-)